MSGDCLLAMGSGIT